MTREERIEISSNEYFANANEQISAYIAYRAGINSPLAQELQEEDAIGFANFLLWYVPVGNERGDLVWWRNVHTDETHTTKKLYLIYKLSKKLKHR